MITAASSHESCGYLTHSKYSVNIRCFHRHSHSCFIKQGQRRMETRRIPGWGGVVQSRVWLGQVRHEARQNLSLPWAWWHGGPRWGSWSLTRPPSGQATRRLFLCFLHVQTWMYLCSSALATCAQYPHEMKLIGNGSHPYGSTGRCQVLGTLESDGTPTFKFLLGHSGALGKIFSVPQFSLL